MSSSRAGAAEAPELPTRESQYLAVAFLGALLVVNVYRAATQSIVHDEAFTYNWFIAGPPVPPPDANNHVLNTLLARRAIALLGASELVLRLPSLLGGALCFAALFTLARGAFAEGSWFLLAMAITTLNPFFLDLVCAARGYGLATAFMLWAIILMMRAASVQGPGDVRARWLWLAASLALGLSLSASLGFLLVDTSLAALFAAMVAADAMLALPSAAPRRLTVRLVVWFALPGPLLATVLCWPLLRTADRSQFYVGWNSLGESVSDLVASSLFYARTAISSAADLERDPVVLLGPGSWRATIVWLAVHVVLPLAFVAASGTLMALATEAWRRRGLSSLRARDRLAFLCTGAWTLTLILEVVVHRWLQVKYPPDRAAIWMVPLCTLSVLMLVNRACEMSARWGQTVRWLVLAGGVAVLGVYLANFQVSYFKTWRYDAGTKALWGHIARGRDATGDTPIRVGGHWLFEPSVNFYRRLSDGDAGTRRVLPFIRLAHPDPQQFDYFFFNPVDFPDMDLRRLTVIGVDPVSGVMLVTPKRP